jgi:hypothetical protein
MSEAELASSHGGDQARLKLAGKTLHHRDTETQRRNTKNKKAPAKSGDRLVIPGDREATETMEATENTSCISVW